MKNSSRFLTVTTVAAVSSLLVMIPASALWSTTETTDFPANPQKPFALEVSSEGSSFDYRGEDLSIPFPPYSPGPDSRMYQTITVRGYAPTGTGIDVSVSIPLIAPGGSSPEVTRELVEGTCQEFTGEPGSKRNLLSEGSFHLPPGENSAVFCLVSSPQLEYSGVSTPEYSSLVSAEGISETGENATALGTWETPVISGSMTPLIEGGELVFAPKIVRLANEEG